MSNKVVPYQKTWDFWQSGMKDINGITFEEAALKHPDLMLSTVKSICADMDKALKHLNEFREENLRLRVELGLKRFLE